MSTSGSGARSSKRAHTARSTQPADEQPEGPRGRPAPAVALDDGEQEADERGREQDRPGPVDARRGLDRRLGHEQVRRDDRDDRHDSPSQKIHS